MNKNEVAKGVRVTLNKCFEPGTLLESHYVGVKEVYIRENHVYNDLHGDYVWIYSPEVNLSTPIHLYKLELFHSYPEF